MSTPQLRAEVVALPAYVPGRKVPGAITLASNETPYGHLPGVAERIAELSASTARYADMGSTTLLAAIAEAHGVEPDRVAVGAGSVEVAGQLVSAVAGAGDEVLFGWRAFEAYPILTTRAGATPVRVPLVDHRHDLPAMAAAVTGRTRLVFVCNPNNPTSTAVGEDALRAFVDAVPADVLVVVDEAYREYVDGDVPDAFALFGDRPNVAVLRTFSKAYGLAGLRVGYCLAHPDVAAQVRKVQTPFSVSGLAQEAAICALAQAPEALRRARLVVAERDRVTAELRGLGYAVPDSQANFVWLVLGERAAGFAEHCLAGGVVVRPFAGEGVRVTIGLPEENEAFLRLAKELS